MTLVQKYLKEYYEYAKNVDYIISNVGKQSNYAQPIYTYPRSKEKVFFNEYHWLNNFNLQEITSKDYFSRLVSENKIKEMVFTQKNDPVFFDFFINFFHKASTEEKKEILKDPDKFINHNDKWPTSIFKLIESPKTNAKESLFILSTLPVSEMTIYALHLPDLDELISKKNIPREDLDKFYIKFLKARKNQIKNANTGPGVKQFLIDKYGRNEEKLKPYFPFFNHIKEEFEEIDLNIEEEVSEYINATRINCRKGSQLICIPSMTEYLLKLEIQYFCTGLEKYKKFDKIMVDDVASSKGIIEVRTYSSFPFHKEELSGLIKDFLRFKKMNPSMQTTSETVQSFLLNKDLQKQLPNKDNSIMKKMKI